MLLVWQQIYATGYYDNRRRRACESTNTAIRTSLHTWRRQRSLYLCIAGGAYATGEGDVKCMQEAAYASSHSRNLVPYPI
jgi:hypothetical protein